MSDIQTLEGRITAALDRIRYSAGKLAAGTEVAAPPQIDQSDDIDALRAQLDEERTANAQLEERVKALKDRQDGNVASMENTLSEKSAALAGIEAEIQRLRASNAELRDLNAQLRSAAADGAASPELINRATLAEVEALQAQRAADVAEIDAILGELKPLIEEA